jgi:hypothetical protein
LNSVSKVDDPSYPHRSVCVEAQREGTQPQQRCTWRLWLGGRPSARHQLQAFQQDRQAAGFIDEIDGATIESASS